MKIYLKQQVFSWRDRFFVKDEFGDDRYVVEGELLAIGNRLHIYEMTGRRAASIRQKVMSLLSRFFVEIDGRVVCEIVKDFTLFKQHYWLEGIPWRMDGDFLDHNYRLHDGFRQVMRMSKRWFTWGDSYELDIFDPRDELLSLCVALAVNSSRGDDKVIRGPFHPLSRLLFR